MFEGWQNPPDAVSYRPIDRPVQVLTTGMFPAWGTSSVSLAPLPIQRHCLALEAFHPGRQIAWVRLSYGTWLAVVEVELTIRDGLIAVQTVLWL
ncbi:cullin [Mycobacterium sp. CBMA293]|uniref:hypothetical protein n=1 Tax=unclassified Mycolicibacterium TaxID=2636767 RepID=UPI0012DC68D0|nr:MULTISPECIES: hypothetical protein [unclassified Mycolicibacterium]MUL48664.1 cullin [Mycolicibacterium sp. CBMA 360]MUL60838.1 cullin [Mycolicibacterium sp. CBMA 335]MUL71851.1 cullin [Mycolicibacterium sp. CBMA 311]MUL95779.1 cullin [Mycolicibacterium sp. CBMA 230]MUM06377.1 hypothetical protein [Mycolicibacterium sp. CBMA 213]